MSVLTFLCSLCTGCPNNRWEVLVKISKGDKLKLEGPQLQKNSGNRYVNFQMAVARPLVDVGHWYFDCRRVWVWKNFYILVSKRFDTLWLGEFFEKRATGGPNLGYWANGVKINQFKLVLHEITVFWGHWIHFSGLFWH